MQPWPGGSANGHPRGQREEIPRGSHYGNTQPRPRLLESTPQNASYPNPSHHSGPQLGQYPGYFFPPNNFLQVPRFNYGFPNPQTVDRQANGTAEVFHQRPGAFSADQRFYMNTRQTPHVFPMYGAASNTGLLPRYDQALPQTQSWEINQLTYQQPACSSGSMENPQLEDGRKKVRLAQRKPEDASEKEGDDEVREDEEEVAKGLRGEKRLVIQFENYGDIKDKEMETCGKKRKIYIPNGIKGNHNVYGEPWNFEVTYRKIDDLNVIHWKVTNLSNSQVYESTEDLVEREQRKAKGRTISNRVFKEAMRHRSAELEAQAKEEAGAERSQLLLSKARRLRPKKFTEGTLVFGLQHQSVQDMIKESQQQSS